MAERIEITIIAEDGASRTFTAVADSASDMGQRVEGAGDQVEGAGGKSDSLASGLGNITSALTVLGIAVSAGAILDLGVQLDVAGAKANRITDSFNVFTGGRADEYAKNIQGAVNGLIDDEDALLVSQTLINNGMAKTSEEAATLIRNATILGASFGQVGAKEAAEDFALLLNTLSPRQMKEFGLGIDEVRAKTDELMKTNDALSEREATRLAILELSSSKAATFSGVLDDQAAHLDVLDTRWQDLGESIGKALSPITDPAVEAAINILNTDINQTVDNADHLSVWGQRVKDARDEMQKTLDSGVYADSIEAMRTIRDQHTDQFYNDLAKAEEEARIKAEEFNLALDKQAGLQMDILKNVGQVQGQAQTQAGVYQLGQQAIADMNIPLSQQMLLMEDLGLATNQITGDQIAWTNQFRELQNLMAAGKLTVDGYKLGMQELATATDGAHSATTALIKSITDKHGAIKDSDIGDKQLIKNLDDARGSSQDVETQMKKIQDAREKLNNAPPTQIKMDQGQIDTASKAIDGVKQQLEALQATGFTIGVTLAVDTGGLPL